MATLAKKWAQKAAGAVRRPRPLGGEGQGQRRAPAGGASAAPIRPEGAGTSDAVLVRRLAVNRAQKNTKSSSPSQKNPVRAIPDGQLCRCDACADLHWCTNAPDPHPARALGKHRPRTVGSESNMGGNERTGENRTRADGGGAGPDEGAEGAQDQQDGGGAASSIPNTPEHAVCRRTLGALKGNLTKSVTARQNAAEREKKLQKELKEAKRGIEAAQAAADTAEAENNHLLGRCNKLEADLEAARKELHDAERPEAEVPPGTCNVPDHGKVPLRYCNIPRHASPDNFCSIPEHGVIPANFCNVPEHDEPGPQRCTFNSDTAHCSVQRHQDLAGQMDALTQQLHTAGQRANAAEERAEEAAGLMEAAQRSADEASRRSKSAEDAAAKLEERREAAHRDAAAKEHERDELARLVVRLREQQKASESRIEILQQNIASLEESSTGSEDAQRKQSTIDDLQATLEAKEAQLQIALSEASGSKADAHNAACRLHNLQGEYDKLNQKCTEAQERVVELTSSEAALRDRLNRVVSDAEATIIAGAVSGGPTDGGSVTAPNEPSERSAAATPAERAHASSTPMTRAAATSALLYDWQFNNAAEIYQLADEIRLYANTVKKMQGKLPEDDFFEHCGNVRRFERRIDDVMVAELRRIDKRANPEGHGQLDNVIKSVDARLQKIRSRLAALDQGVEAEQQDARGAQQRRRAERGEDDRRRPPPGDPFGDELGAGGHVRAHRGGGDAGRGEGGGGRGGGGGGDDPDPGDHGGGGDSSDEEDEGDVQRGRGAGGGGGGRGAGAPDFDDEDLDEEAFYGSLPEPWNIQPRGPEVSFTTYSKLMNGNVVRPFSGDVAGYAAFRRDFITHFHRKRLEVLLKFNALRTACTPAMNDFLEGLEASAAGYAHFIRRLELEFGGPDRQLVAFSQDVKSCKIVKSGDVKGMQALVDAVTRYHAALPAHRLYEAQAMQHGIDVLEKLSDELQLDFRRHCQRMGVEQEHNAHLIIQWLKLYNLKHLRRRDDRYKKKTSAQPSGGGAAAASKARGAFYADGGSASYGAAGHSAAGPAAVCIVCGGAHRLINCDKYKAKPPTVRRALVVGAELCSNCLQAGHTRHECSDPREKCDTCGAEHHTLVHGWEEATAAGRGGRGRGGGRGRNGRGGGTGAGQQQPQQQQQEQPQQQQSGDGGGGRQQQQAGGASAAALAAAPAQGAGDGEKVLYSSDQSQARAFMSRAVFSRAPRTPSRESSGWGSRANVMISYAPQQHPGVPAVETTAAGPVLAMAGGVEDESFVSLRFTVIRMRDPASGKSIVVNTLLDDGASLSSLSQRAADALGLRGEMKELTVTGFGGNVTTSNAEHCKVRLESANGNFVQDGAVAVVEDPVGDLFATDWRAYKNKWRHLQGIEFPEPLGGGKVDFILGVDHGVFHRALDERYGGEDAPAARLTPAGWTAVGPTLPDAGSTRSAVLVAASYDAVGVCRHPLPSLTEIDDPDPAAVLDGAVIEHELGPLCKRSAGVLVNASDRRAVAAIAQSHSRTETGRIEVRPLWAGDARPPNNYDAAAADWKRTRGYLKEKGLLAEYLGVFDKWLSNDYIEKVPQQDEKEGFFLPHFPVIRRDNKTTKVRVVANGAARFKGVSLNDCMVPGPKLLNSLVQVLLRFRRFPHAVIADVEHMFLRVSVPSADRRYHRFVVDGADERGSLVSYQAKGHVFGSAGSLTIAVAVLKLAALRAERARLGADAILKSSMVDDILASHKTTDGLAALARQLQDICGSVEMRLHKWCTNCPGALPRGAETVEGVEIKDKSSPGEEEEHKPLGVFWRPATDAFSFKYNKKTDGPKTKLAILKLYMGLFDPLGTLLPVIMTARMLYRDLWKEGVGWHEEAPPDLATKWDKWFAQLEELPGVTFPRCVDLESSDRLAVFADASEDGYGAACYLYSEEATGRSKSVLVYARGRVNGNKARTIPVLELLGAELAVIAAREVARAFDFELEEVDFFLDSQPVLSWIRRPARDVSAHVGRKIAQIRQATPPKNWHYVPTAENPADLVSRGMALTELISSSLWWNGPEFLPRGEAGWPELAGEAEPSVEVPGEEIFESIVGIYTARGAVCKSKEESPFKSFNEWRQAVRAADRIAAWAARTVARVRRQPFPADPRPIRTSPLAALEMEQRALWPQEHSLIREGKPLPERHPWRGFDIEMRAGVMVLGGRVSRPGVPVLGRQSHLGALWLRHVHEVKLHHAGGHRAMVQASRSEVWIVGAIAAARAVVRSCVECRTAEPTNFAPREALLPRFRIGEADRQGVFTHILVDHCGPYLTKQGRGRVAHKRWIFVITCGAVRAVHFELVQSRSTEETIAALVRFSCRRTVPELVVSDNAPEFVAAAAALRRLGAAAGGGADAGGARSWEALEWRHYPAYAAHFGGAVEAIVKLCKRTLHKLIKDRTMGDLELAHALVVAEYLVNGRPIGDLSSDPRDPAPLTAQHLLAGAAGADLALRGPVGTNDAGAAFCKLQAVMKQRWDAALPAAVANLQERKIWRGDRPTPQPGDLVIALDVPHLPHRSVSLARVEAVRAGADGIAREADIYVRGKKYRRAVHSLAPLLEAE